MGPRPPHPRPMPRVGHVDHSNEFPNGIVENVVVEVWEMLITPTTTKTTTTTTTTTYFVLMDIKDDDNIPLFVGRPFLATVAALVNIKNKIKKSFSFSNKVVKIQYDNHIFESSKIYSFKS